MRGAVMYAPRDVRVEDRPGLKIINPTDAIIKLAATCVCGSDLWDYRGINPVTQPTPMGHEYAGVVLDVGAEVTSVKPCQFVIGSFFASDGTCPNCRAACRSRRIRSRVSRVMSLSWRRPAPPGTASK
jgi:threonine dehydrogenase-like Zn-dependent dehydrogenase